MYYFKLADAWITWMEPSEKQSCKISAFLVIRAAIIDFNESFASCYSETFLHQWRVYSIHLLKNLLIINFFPLPPNYAYHPSYLIKYCKWSQKPFLTVLSLFLLINKEFVNYQEFNLCVCGLTRRLEKQLQERHT